eukprot:1157277-Pelagomonas_calceolata.AAC.1
MHGWRYQQLGKDGLTKSLTGGGSIPGGNGGGRGGGSIRVASGGLVLPPAAVHASHGKVWRSTLSEHACWLT